MKRIWWLIWGVAFLAGLYGLYLRLGTGHTLANYTSYVPWGLWVAAYVFFSGISAGAYLLSTLVYLFRFKRLEAIGRLALLTSLVSLVGALIMIALDLGHMWRFWEVFTRPNFSSMMAWMVWFYTIFFLVTLVQSYYVIKGGDAKTIRVLAGVGLVVAVAFSGGVGALFGVVGAKPFWNIPLYPVLFLVSAVLSGTAVVTFLAAFFGPGRGTAEHGDLVRLLGQITLGLLAFDALFEWAEYSIGYYTGLPGHEAAMGAMLTGPYWWVFWVVHLLIGVVVPLAILAFQGRSIRPVGLASLLIFGTFLAVRLNILMPAQVVPELAGLEQAFTDSRLSFTYTPSGMEWLVTLFVMSLAVAGIYLGYRYLPPDGPGRERSEETHTTDAAEGGVLHA